MTIAKKISLTAAVLVLLTIISNAVALYATSGISKNVETIVGDSLVCALQADQMLALMKEQRIAMLEHIGARSPQETARAENAIASTEANLQDLIKEYGKFIDEPQEREIFEKIAPAHEKVIQVWSKAQNVSRAGNSKAAFDIWYAEVIPAARDQIKAIGDLNNFNKSQAQSNATQVRNSASTAKFSGWLMMLLSVICGGALATLVVRNLNRVLYRMVGELSEGAEQITSAAGQVAGSSQSLAKGSSEQAASLEETSASTEQITSMTQKNAENSQSAADVMTAVDHHVKDSNSTLEQMVVSMSEINASSGKISKIIKVIDEIAFQTNILALNAAVEAARAGEAGMGFAVVADEVRNLAQRSAQAAKDTASLIEESIAKSNDGSKKLQQVTEVIRAITDSSLKVKTLVDEVNLGSQEQSRGISQIATAIQRMDQVTQSTAASAEESASASEQLAAQAQAMNHIVSELRTLVGSKQTTE